MKYTASGKRRANSTLAVQGIRRLARQLHPKLRAQILAVLAGWSE